MKLKNISYEELNAFSKQQMIDILSPELKVVRERIHGIENAMGSSQATRSFNEKYGEGVPYAGSLKNMNFGQIKQLAFAVREFEREKTSTLQGARKSINSMFAKMGHDPEETKKIRDKMGGYRGVSKMLDMVDEIRKFAPSLEYTLGSDGDKMEAIVTAFNETKIKDPQMIALRAREIYEQLQSRRNDAFPFTV